MLSECLRVIISGKKGASVQGTDVRALRCLNGWRKGVSPGTMGWIFSTVTSLTKHKPLDSNASFPQKVQGSLKIHRKFLRHLKNTLLFFFSFFPYCVVLLARLKLTALFLPLPLKCWHYRHAPSPLGPWTS